MCSKQQLIYISSSDHECSRTVHSQIPNLIHVSKLNRSQISQISTKREAKTIAVIKNNKACSLCPLSSAEFHIPPINVPTLSPIMAFEMLPGSLRLKTTTVPANYKLAQLEPILIDKHRKGRRKKGAKLHSQKL